MILAMDTGDGDAIEQWTREGRLPTIRSILERGCWGRTAGPEMICEYGVGLTLFSGVSRREHGYYYFRQLQPGTYDLEIVRPPVASAPPFWSHLRATDARMLIVDVPDIRPVPGLAGLQLSNWGTHHGSAYAMEAEPPELLEDVRRTVGRRMVIHAGTDVAPEAGLKIRSKLLERVRRKGALCRELLTRGPFDLVVIFFSETDGASHAFWKYRPEAAVTKPGRHESLRHAIRDVYEAIDAEMGNLLELLPSGANVFILSLYGIQDEYPASTLIDSLLRQLGYHVDGGAGDQDGKKRVPNALGLARRIMPEHLREAISRRLPTRFQERLLATRLRDTTDWRRTTAFAVPSLCTSFVRVNLRGREPRGIVSPGAEYDAVLDRLAGDLTLLVDKETGSLAVRRTARTTDLFGGGPSSSLPDLFVEWEPGPRMLTTVLHPKATLFQPPPAYVEDSQEKLTGFVSAAGPAIGRAGPLGDIDLVDLAPTFLSLLGQPVPASMSGRPIEAMRIG